MILLLLLPFQFLFFFFGLVAVVKTSNNMSNKSGKSVGLYRVSDLKVKAFT